MAMSVRPPITSAPEANRRTLSVHCHELVVGSSKTDVGVELDSFVDLLLRKKGYQVAKVVFDRHRTGVSLVDECSPFERIVDN